MPTGDIDALTTGVFTTGSTMKHVVSMTAAGAVGLVSIFVVDLLNLFYISLLGKEELTAAVGYASTVLFFTISYSIGFTIAATAIVSRAFGAGDIVEAKVSSGATLIYICVINTITAAILFPFLGPILSLLGAGGNTHTVALDFIQIVVLAIPLMGIAMCLSGILRAKGDGKRAMFVTLSAGIAAAILDPLFIFYFELGVRGAAISTALSRVVMLCVGFYGVWHIHKIIAVPSRDKLISLMPPYLRISIPALLTQLATPFSIAYLTAAMSEFGDGAVSGLVITNRLVPLAFVGLFTLSAAVGPILGQNLGARKYDRINSTMWNSLLFTLIYTMVMWGLLILLANEISNAFRLSGDAADLVVFFCYFIGGTYLFQGGLYVANAAFNNLGYPFYSTIFNWGRATIGTVPFILIGAKWGPKGALLGYGIGGIMFGIAAVVACFWLVNRLPEKMAAEDSHPN